MIYFTSDLHLGHANVITFDSRPFTCIEEMDTEIIKRWNQKVKKQDTVYILGDISWYKTDKTIEILKKLTGKKILIKGNHDRINSEITKCFESVSDYREIKADGRNVILSHYPIHFFNKHYHDAVMLYGHVHSSKEEEYVQKIRKMLIDDGIPCEMYNVGCMHWDYEPVTFVEIVE